MAVTILEALQNANRNIDNVKRLGMVLLPLVKEQLSDAVVLLEKGYGLYDKVGPLLEKYGDVENVPEKLKDKRKICTYPYACRSKATLTNKPYNLCDKEYCMFQEEKKNG